MYVEDFRIAIGLELKPNAVENLKEQITSIQTNPIKLTFDTKGVQKITRSIRDETEKIQLAYKELLSVIQNIGSLKVKIAGLDSKKDTSQIATLTTQLEKLQQRHDNLRASFNQKFDVGQLVGLNEAWQKVSNKVDEVNSKMAGKSKQQQLKIDTQQIQTEYNKLLEIANRVNNIRITLAGLDSTKDSQRIIELSSQLNQLNTDYNRLYDVTHKRFTTDQIDNLNRVFDITNNKIADVNAHMADTTAIKQTTSAYKELLSISNQLSKLEPKTVTLSGKVNKNELAEVTAQVERLRNTYQQLLVEFNGRLSPEQMATLSAETYKANDALNILKAKMNDIQAEASEGILLKLDDNNVNSYTNEIRNLETEYSKLKTSNSTASESINKVKVALEGIKSARASGDTNALIEANDRYTIALKNANEQIKANAKSQKELYEAQNLASSKAALSTRMDAWLRDNSAAAGQFGSQIRQLQAELQTCDKQRLGGIRSEFEALTNQARMAGKATLSLTDKLKKQFSSLSVYFSASMMITRAITAIRSMYNNVVEVNTAMTELYRVTDLTAQKYDEMYDRMTSSAKEYGVVLSDIINSTASWVRLGFSPDESMRLAEITSMYQHVTDLDEATAVENLVTAYKGFQDQLLELYDGDSTAAVEYIADVFDKLGNEYALAADDVGEALTRSASALSLAGNTIQETAG